MLKSKPPVRVSIPETVGQGYGKFWKFKGRYRVVKGSRASKKSKTTALWIIASMMMYPEANTLVVRKVFRTLQDSCYADLQWAASRLQVADSWEFKKSPLEAIYNPTGQKILFRGLDDPLKVTSIAVTHGCLCWCWIEEAYEVMNEADFDMIDESIRGIVPDGLFKQITLTFNPWNEKIWLKGRFFDHPDPDTLAITTNYMCNEWLDEQDRKTFESMKKRNPKRYQVAGLGHWGVVEGLVYENWEEHAFTLPEIQKKHDDLDTCFGLDFGYTNDPTAGFVGFISPESRTIYVYDEFYKKGMSNRVIAETIRRMRYAKDRWTGDSAEPKSIDELRGMDININGAKKGKDSINNGIQFIQDYHIIVHPRCVNFITEISNYTWDKDKFGHTLNRPIDDFNHLMDAMRYGIERFITDDEMTYVSIPGGII